MIRVEMRGLMKISEISKKTHMSADTLRYYEKEGLIGPVRRVDGIRNYSDYDLERIIFIQHMRRAGMKLATLKEYLNMVDNGDSTMQDRQQILIDHKATIDEEIQTLQEISDLVAGKIESYGQRMCAAEEKLRALKKS